MSRVAYQLAERLKSLDASGPDQRMPRSMLLVHAFAMKVPLLGISSVEEACETYAPKLKELIGKINENITIDSRLACALLHPILKIRFELLYGVNDALLIKLALESETAKEIQSIDQQVVSDFLVSHPTYIEVQRSICEAIDELIPDVD